MFHTKTFFILIVLLLKFVYASNTESDSLAYISLRERVAESNPDDQILLTTDVLAESGLYADAIELLNEYTGSKDISQQTPLADSLTARWSISTGVDYYHLEDINTDTMTQEEYQQYKRLTETPLSLWIRARSTIKPVKSFVKEITPEIQISESKLRLETATRLSFLNELLYLEPSVKAVKWFWADTSGQSPFKPATPPPSLMSGLSFRLSTQNISDLSNKLQWSMPVCVDWEHYQSDKPGYESFVEYSLIPSLEIRSTVIPVNTRLSASTYYEDYYKKGADSLDVFRLSVRAESSMRMRKLNTSVSIFWIGDRYVQSPALESADRFESAFRAMLSITDIIKTRIHIRGIHEREANKSDSNLVTSRLKGSEIMLNPGIDFNLKEKMIISPEMRFEHRFAHSSIWKAMDGYEFGMKAELLLNLLNLSAWGGYRYEDIYKSSKSDNRSFKINGEVNFSPVDILSLNIFSDYQYRLYPFTDNSRVSENLTLSSNLQLML